MPIATGEHKERMAVHYGTEAVTASLHTADPGTTGASEVTGGSPAYARQALTWAVGTDDDGIVTASATFDVPAGVTVTHAGIWSGDATPVFLDSADLVDQTYSSQGTLQVNFTYEQS